MRIMEKNVFITNVVSNNIHTYNKIFAIATLLDIAAYYNNNCNVDWTNDENKYLITYSYDIDKYVITTRCNVKLSPIYFINEKDAETVINNPNFRDILDKVYKD